MITVTCSGFVAPGFDFTLINELPLRPDIARTQIGFMGCHAALNALRVARAFVAADPDAIVLVCCVELCTLHYQYGWDPEQIVANSLFADGSGACVVQAAHDPPKTSNGSDHRSSSRTLNQIIASGSIMLPDSDDAMTWRVGDHGFRMTLSSRVPGILAEHLRGWMTKWLSQYELTPDQIVTWAVHPGGPRILNAFAEAMSIPTEALNISREIMQTHGNMSSPTVLFVLDRLRNEHASGPCVAIGFGPGLVAEATLDPVMRRLASGGRSTRRTTIRRNRRRFDEDVFVTIANRNDHSSGRYRAQSRSDRSHSSSFRLTGPVIPLTAA